MLSGICETLILTSECVSSFCGVEFVAWTVTDNGSPTLAEFSVAEISIVVP